MKERIASAIKWSFFFKTGAQLGNWIITIWVMRLLEPEDYGRMALLIPVYGLLFLIKDFGLTPALVQKKELEAGLREKTFSIVLLGNLCLLALGLGISYLLAWFYGDPALVLLGQAISLVFLFTALEILPDAQLRREMRFKERSAVEASARLVSGAVALVLALSGMGVWALVAGYVLFLGLRAIGKAAICPFRPGFVLSLAGLRGLLSFGGIMSLNQFCWHLYSELDKVLIGRFLTTASLGFYNVALSIVNIPLSKMSEVLNAVLMSSFADVQEDMSAIRYQFGKVLELAALVYFPVLFGISAIAPELITLLIGPKWQMAVPLMEILAILVALQALAALMAPVYLAIGRPQLALQATVTNLLIVMPAIVIGLNWGILGVCWAWLLSFPFAMMVNWHRGLKAWQMSLPQALACIARPFILSLAMWAGIKLLRMTAAAPIADWAWLLGAITGGAVFYLVGSLLVNGAAVRYFWGLLRPAG